MRDEFVSTGEDIQHKTPTIPEYLNIKDFEIDGGRKMAEPVSSNKVPPYVNEFREPTSSEIERRLDRIEESVEQINHMGRMAIISAGILLFGILIIRHLHR